MKRLTSLALMLPCVLVNTVIAAAQSQAAQPSQYIHVITVTVKPGAGPAYESFTKKIAAGAEKIGAAQRWMAWMVTIGGPGRTYNIVLPFEKWSEVDGWTPVPQILSKAYGEVEGRRIMAAGTAAIERSETSVLRILPDLSSRPQAFNARAGYLQLIVTEVEPAMVPAWEGYLARLKAAQEKSAESPSAVRRVAVLGASNTYATAVAFGKFAERDGWRMNMDLLRDAYGQAQADSLNTIRLRSTRNSHQMVLLYRPDLSRPGATPEAASR
jgi:hypothetical protein